MAPIYGADVNGSLYDEVSFFILLFVNKRTKKPGFFLLKRLNGFESDIFNGFYILFFFLCARLFE